MYSQNKEDEFVLDYFKNEAPETLTVVELGANDGKTLSNSLALIEAGWKAILVEPSPKALERLDILHAGNENVLIYPIGIYVSNGLYEFHESGGYKDGNDISLYSTIKPVEKMRWHGDVEFSEIFAPFITWEYFRAENQSKKFDFISIDCEGVDTLILQTIDLQECGCRCLCIEWNGIEENKTIAEQYCNKYGLTLKVVNAENLIFAI